MSRNNKGSGHRGAVVIDTPSQGQSGLSSLSPFLDKRECLIFVNKSGFQAPPPIPEKNAPSSAWEKESTSECWTSDPGGVELLLRWWTRSSSPADLLRGVIRLWISLHMFSGSGSFSCGAAGVWDTKDACKCFGISLNQELFPYSEDTVGIFPSRCWTPPGLPLVSSSIFHFHWQYFNA